MRKRSGRLACCLPLLAATGCAAGADGATGPVVWGVAGAVAVGLSGVTAVGVRRRAAKAAQRERETLRVELARLEARLAEAIGERGQLTRQHQELLQAQVELVRERDEAVRERDELLGSVDATFVNLAMRTLSLVERQLVLIEGLEGREADAAQLESLFRLDHLATRMRRNSENMLLLAGLENSRRGRTAVSLLDVVRAAVSEIERYERVRIGFLAAVRLSGAVADDTSHLLAELLENATAFSPPQDRVEVGGWLLDNGEVMLSVADRGIGLPAERLRQLNEQLAEEAEPVADRTDPLLAGALTGRSMGLFVVARLARRHGIRVQLRENAQGGGVTAMVVLPREALLQDSFTLADLDEQRRAERSVSAAAAVRAEEHGRGAQVEERSRAVRAEEHARAAQVEEHARAAQAEELPVLPRRKPAPVPAPQPAVEQAVEPAVEQADAPAPPSQEGPVTDKGLPRRVPRANGLPGTGESPASDLPRARLAAGAGGRVSPEELRRRLGGFQGGVRQAEAAAGRTGTGHPAVPPQHAQPPGTTEQRPGATREEQDRR